MLYYILFSAQVFLSTPSARRATWIIVIFILDIAISIHALREEGDLFVGILTSLVLHFYPRPPRGGRRSCRWPFYRSRNFYPRPPRGGRPIVNIDAQQRKEISIHALREEGDISSVARVATLFKFLSTPSARRATEHKPEIPVPEAISIHALREEGDVKEALADHPPT